MRPVFRGMCRLESIIDGTLDLEHLALANDYIDAQDENDRRVEDAYASAARDRP